MAREFDTYVDGLNDVLRAFRKLPKEASVELKTESSRIAANIMVPAWRDAAMEAGPWGDVLADSIRVRKDRLPAVNIGGNRKKFSGGATPTMVRYPSSSGQARDSFAPFERTNWMEHARTYIGPAMQAWGQAVDRVVKKWEYL